MVKQILIFFYHKIIDEYLILKEQLQTMQTATQQRDYWGRPKKTSNKIVDDVSYEQQTERRYQRLVQEVKAGTLDINNLTHQEQQVVRKLLNE